MAKKTSITLGNLIKKFRVIDTSKLYELNKKSDKILWTLFIIKKKFKIEEFIPTSVLVSILVDALGISITDNSLRNSLNPLKTKIHKKTIEEELSYKIMQEGITHIETLIREDSKKKQPSSQKSRKEREANVRDAIKTAYTLGKQKHIQPGLYYVVLIDLVGSSTASANISPEKNKERIKKFIEYTKKALPKKTRKDAIFIKDIGDASLFLFSNFQDILDWAEKTDSLCDEYNKKCITAGLDDIYQMYTKKCVHIGEVQFDKQNDPIALVINQISKIEKEFTKDQLGITDVVKQVILPRINSGDLKATKVRNVKLHGETDSKPLWNIAY